MGKVEKIVGDFMVGMIIGVILFSFFSVVSEAIEERNAKVIFNQGGRGQAWTEFEVGD